VKITIDKEFKELIPPLSHEEFSQLEQNILTDGCRDPLVVWRLSEWDPANSGVPLKWEEPDVKDRNELGEYRIWKNEFLDVSDDDSVDEYWCHDWPRVLLDGHNRYEICTKHGIDFEIIELEFNGKEDAADWIDRNQAGRRNATPEQLRLIRGRIYNRMKKAHGAPEGNQNRNIQRDQIEPVERTADKLAEQFKVSPATIKRDGQLAESVEALGITEDYTKGEIKATTPEIIEAAKPVVEAKRAEKEWEKESEKRPLAPPPKPEPVVPAVVEAIKEELKKPHVARNTGDNEWYTPPVFIEAATAVLGGIDLDPASSEIANRTVKAKIFYTESDDGLSKDWPVGRIWMNPPYAQPAISRFCTRIVDEVSRGSSAIVLVNNGTETQWFQCMAAECSAVCFPKSRVRFLDPEGNPGAPLQGQAIVYFGSNTKEFSKHFSQFGAIFYRE
jgi:hypothetical protein